MHEVSTRGTSASAPFLRDFHGRAGEDADPRDPDSLRALHAQELPGLGTHCWAKQAGAEGAPEQEAGMGLFLFFPFLYFLPFSGCDVEN